MPRKGEHKYTAQQLQAHADQYLKDCKENGKIPFLIGLANKLDVDASTLSDWSKENTSYAKVVKRVKRQAEQALIDKAITENKPVFPIFLLKSVFGYQESSKLDITTNGESLGVVQLPAKE